MFLNDMFKNKKPEPKLPSGLTSAEKKQVLEIIRKAENKSSVPRTSQESIPFIQMYKDGTCKVTEGFFSRTIEFGDINYRLALEDDQHAIFDAWCAFLNFFDSSVKFEIGFLNTVVDEEEYKKQIYIPMKDDGFDPVREEYSDMIKKQLTNGNKGLMKRKFITFGIEAKDISEARSKLSNIETGILNNFKKLGAAANALNGRDRLEVMHAMYHIGEKQNF